ncbi:NmrA family protein [Trichoderma harzianum]|uniref:NmrA family protein n=1 Tax=Trichoderma harzianum TaxID=5544 RepID=A0A0F9X1J2_TRIHA|nr:NmrA family protein [Trichoderma harzianum]
MVGDMSFENARVLVFGGTGAQGRSIVQGITLARTKRYRVSVLTRNKNSTQAAALASSFPDVQFVEGSYTTEEGLRNAFANQDVVYFSIDSFNVGEPFEYFWTFRAYEIAVQSKLKWFIFAGAGDRYGKLGMDEKYRNSHNIVSSGVYAEMLGILLRPTENEDGFIFQNPVDDDSVMPLLPLEMYGYRLQWALAHPEESIGKMLSAGPFFVTFPEIAAALQQVTGKKAQFKSITTSAWMEAISGHVDPDRRLPRGADPTDPTSFTFRKSFGAWWNIWKEQKEKKIEDMAWADEVYPERPRSLKEWMQTVGYEGKQIVPLYEQS